mgnify:FL=1
MKKRAFGGALLALLMMISVAYGHYRQELSLRTAYVPPIAMNNTYKVGEDVRVAVKAPDDPILDTAQTLTFTVQWGQETTGKITTWQVQQEDATVDSSLITITENGDAVTLSIPQNAETKPQAGQYQLVATVWCQCGEATGEATLSIPFFVNYRTSVLRTGVIN